SRPPFLTALALWPKGNCWGGGGEFVSKQRVRLNHRSDEMGLDDGFTVPKAMKVEPFDEHSGRGEDSPIHDRLLIRNGWQLTQQGEEVKHELSSPIWFSISPPHVWSRRNPVVPALVLRTSIHGIHMRDGPWYVLNHAVMLNDQLAVDVGQ